MNINFKGVIQKFRLRLIFEEKVRPVEKNTYLGNVGIQMTMCLLMFHKYTPQLIDKLSFKCERSFSPCSTQFRTGTLKLGLFSRVILWSGLKSNVEPVSSGLCNHSFFERVDGCLSIMVQEKQTNTLTKNKIQSPILVLFLRNKNGTKEVHGDNSSAQRIISFT